MRSPTETPTDERTTEQRIRLRIPKHYHQEPVISHLVSHYDLTVNIVAAILGANANGDGWFDLNLQGSSANIEAALSYLDELDLEVWRGEESDGW
ncbi:NIL domain-containing protein [Leptolyngbya sp. NIES-2104]|uniref:NIL domain-containing protein n=1 Tax=Leptolyngbya sp. NIES-2104 TaxID=1552121 RepID=UPI0006ECC59E|nr:NIL domain-containing protein [Leptolyngbya sp. NIES-2104]GAP97675.1 ferredoxin [Leptolyngbya sp. NIES-2104]